MQRPFFRRWGSNSTSSDIDSVAVAEKHISDPDFSVEVLCDEIGMSLMNLHRKLNSIIGKTACEFIREIRIKGAGQLLASCSKSVSEVMEEVGISSNSHFNKYFKEVHGHTPKEHVKTVSKQSSHQ